jgi:GxxExxY protein
MAAVRNQLQAPGRGAGCLPWDTPQLRLSCRFHRSLLVEIKSIERLLSIHQAQVLTYMRLDLRQGLLMNFNTNRLVDGLRNLLR